MTDLSFGHRLAAATTVRAAAELESAASPTAAVRACVRIEEITRRVTGGDR